MRRRAIPLLLALSVPLPALGGPAGADDPCRPAITAAEQAHAIPARLLAAIARVESGRRDPTSGKMNPWPWTINMDGQGSFYDLKQQAVSAATTMRPRAVRSIDVGCMQISLTNHPDAFASMEQAFDPAANADYGARFLRQLYDKTQSWPKAVGMYHSATPDVAAEYQTRVYAVWPEELQSAPARTLFASLPPFGASWIHPQAHPLQPAGPRIIPLGNAGPGSVMQGRSLDSYRMMPVRLASRLP